MSKKSYQGPTLANSFKERVPALLASFLCIFIGLIAGIVVLYIINAENAWENGFIRIIQGGFYDYPYGVGKTLTNTAPLIMTGLSVAFAFRTGLFNIGVAGQYTFGAFGALYCAIILQWPWYLCLLASAVCGAALGAIPGIFKAYLNINEVITAIMFNWIALYGVNEFMYNAGNSPMYDSYQTKTHVLAKNFPNAVIPDMGMADFFHQKSTTIAIFIAVAAAILIYVIIDKTIFGYELKACGYNKNAAKYAGVNDKKNIILSIMISGGLAGFGAGLFYLSGGAEWNPLQSTSLPAIGWNGIPVALLAGNNPIGTIFSALFISHISVGGAFLPTRFFPTEVANVIISIIIYLCAFALFFRTKISDFIKKRMRKGDRKERV